MKAKPASEEEKKAMQNDRDNGMSVRSIARKYGRSEHSVSYYTRANTEEATRIKQEKENAEWQPIEKELQELVRIRKRVRRRNALAKKPREIASAGRTYKYWPELSWIDRRWPKD